MRNYANADVVAMLNDAIMKQMDVEVNMENAVAKIVNHHLYLNEWAKPYTENIAKIIEQVDPFVHVYNEKLRRWRRRNKIIMVVIYLLLRNTPLQESDLPLLRAGVVTQEKVSVLPAILEFRPELKPRFFIVPYCSFVQKKSYVEERATLNKKIRTDTAEPSIKSQKKRKKES